MENRVRNLIKIIGVVGCGCNMVNYISQQQVKLSLPVDLIAIDDDARGIHKLKVKEKILRRFYWIITKVSKR